MQSIFIKLLFVLALGYIFIAFFDTRSGWKELSKEYRTDEPLPNIFTPEGTTYMNDISIKGLCVGVSDYGLFLSYLFPANFIYSSLLIPWDEITYEQSVNNISVEKYVYLKLGDPAKSNLRLFIGDIEKIHDEYGEPIFSNKLGELD